MRSNCAHLGSAKAQAINRIKELKVSIRDALLRRVILPPSVSKASSKKEIIVREANLKISTKSFLNKVVPHTMPLKLEAPNRGTLRKKFNLKTMPNTKLSETFKKIKP